MQASGWIQFAIYIVALALITKPMGLYLVRVLDANGRTWLDPVLRPLERVTYRLMRVDSRQEHDWKQYTLAMLLFSLVGCLLTYGILRFQHLLPLNPQGLGPLSEHLAFNTAVSFTTNTNWQSYGGESTMSYFSQMVGLDFSQFRFRRDWHCHCRSVGPRDCPALRQDDRQFLGRPRASDLLPPDSNLPRLRRVSRIAGDDPELPAIYQSEAG